MQRFSDVLNNQALAQLQLLETLLRSFLRDIKCHKAVIRMIFYKSLPYQSSIIILGRGECIYRKYFITKVWELSAPLSRNIFRHSVHILVQDAS